MFLSLIPEDTLPMLRLPVPTIASEIRSFEGKYGIPVFDSCD